MPVPDSVAAEELFIENTRGNDVAVVRVPECEIAARIEVGHHPDDVISSSDGKLIFVNRQQTRDLIVLDRARREIIWSVPLDGVPHHLGLVDNRYVYVALFNEVRDNVVDIETREIVARPPTGFGSHGVHVGAERIYVGSMVQDHIAVVGRDWQTQRMIPFPEAVRPFCPTADERLMYVQLSKRHGFVVVDLETDEIIEQVDLPELPPGTELPRRYPHTVNHGLKLTPDDRYVLAAGSIAGYVAVYTVRGHELVTTVPVGAEPNWIIFNQDAQLAFVSNRAEDTVSILSVPELTELERLEVGRYPQRMAAVPV